jgi:putrescine transport system permease protein
MQQGRGTLGGGGARLVVWVPYAWLIVFFLVPFLIVLKISLSQSEIAQPPYVPVLDLSAGWSGIKAFVSRLNLDNYETLLFDGVYALSYVKSLEVAAISTAILLVIGYPLAYGMACAPRRLQSILVMLVILPFWTSFLIRVYAWMNIMQHDGLLNRMLQAFRLIDEPVAWLPSDAAMYIGIVYSYLPFMVLPLYATLERMDETLLEAAADLGAPRWKAFWLITVPLSHPGVGAGVLLCFIPIVGEFVIPDLLGGDDSLMIGRTLWVEFSKNKDWPVASAIAVALLLVLLVPIAIYQRLQAKAAESGS